MNWKIWMDGENSGLDPTTDEVNHNQGVYATYSEAREVLIATFRRIIINYQNGIKRLRATKKQDRL